MGESGESCGCGHKHSDDKMHQQTDGAQKENQGAQTGEQSDEKEVKETSGGEEKAGESSTK